MTKVLLLPLDERPCNYDFPRLMSLECPDIALHEPPMNILGEKKSPGDFDKISVWLKENATDCDCAVLSVDMLVYGGIVPSRLHHMTKQEAIQRLSVLREIKRAAPSLRIYAFSLIMRAPAYDSSEEEPLFYDLYGRKLYELGCLTDRKERHGLTQEEDAAMAACIKAIPEEVLQEFTNRRAVNHAVNEEAVKLLEEGVVEFLVIPLDDCAAYGWAAREQRRLRMRIAQRRLSNKVYLYSGADEVGSILLARALNEARNENPAVYLQYSSVQGPLVIPAYEDRPLGENLKWQIAAAGGHTCFCAEDADFICMVNAPTAGGERMAQAETREEDMDSSYFSQRCLPEFASALRAFSKRKPVALADVSKANGADNELMDILLAENLIPCLSSYSGWNTAANAAGTCIAHMMLTKGAGNGSFTALRLMEDWGYMANVRKQALTWIEERGGGYFDLKGYEPQLCAYVLSQMRAWGLSHSVPGAERLQAVQYPWHRLFEVSLLFED